MWNIIIFNYLLTTCLFMFCNCKLVDDIRVDKIEVNSHSILYAINHFIENNQEMTDSEKDVLVLRTELKSDQIYIRLAFVEKKHFSWYLIDKDISTYGYFLIENMMVIVYGEDYKNFFHKTDITKSLEFLEIDESNKINGDDRIHGNIPLPPVYIEPLVFVYKYHKKQFIYCKDGLFYLLD